MNPLDEFRSEVSRILAKDAGLKPEEIILEKPPAGFGDLAIPCFTLSKKFRKSPEAIAKELAGKLKPSGLVVRIEQKGGYLNFFADWDKIGQDTVAAVLSERDDYGRANARGNVMVEYCHFNTHKAVHIGHVRTACLGESLSRILEFSGSSVTRVNYQGDIGPHVARCIWGMMKLHGGKGPEKDKGKWLGTVYAEASKKLKENEDAAKEADEINRKIYAGDHGLEKIWRETRKWSLDYFDSIYKEFGIIFDRLYFESETEKPGTEIAKKLLKKGIAKESEGATLIDLEKFGLGIYILIKSDGTPLYSAKDLGLAELKTAEYKKIDKSVHVVGSEQKMYFQQLFKTFELMGSPLAGKSHHLCYELVNLPTGKMASREGVVVLFEDVLAELEKHAKEETEKRNEKMDKKESERISKAIALASLKYDMIKTSPSKTIIFDWKAALDFEGNAAPYLLYTHARANSILKKAEKPESYDLSLLKEPHERALVKLISEFPEVVKKSAEDMRPHYVANFCYDLSTRFNEFYQFVPVLKAEKDLMRARLAIVEAAVQVLKNALNLIGIEALESM
jgi:arginyl-tRNA synthetase